MHPRFRIRADFPLIPAAVNVRDDSYEIRRKPDVIKTTGVADCLAVTLWDQDLQKGGLAHITPRYAGEQLMEDIISRMLADMGDTDTRHLEAALCGEQWDIRHMHLMVCRILAAYSIPIIGQDTGPMDECGRMMYLHTATGLVEVYRV